VSLGLAIVGLGWLSLAIGSLRGCRGPALACVGLLMVVVVVVVVVWPKRRVASFGPIPRLPTSPSLNSLLAAVGSRWPALAFVGLLGLVW